MASSLCTLYPDTEINPPYETIESNSKPSNPSVVVSGGIVSNFNDILIDNTILDIEQTNAKQFPLQTPLAIPQIGGSTNLRLDLPIDNLLNPSSINITVVFSLMKKAANNVLARLEVADGVVPVAGYYPFSNCIVSFDNAEINSPDISNLDLCLIRNLKLMESMKDGSPAEMERMYDTYAGWHLNHQTFANSKIGDYGAYTHAETTHDITGEKAKIAAPLSISDHCFNFQQRNIDKMLTNEFIVTVEIPYTFLEKTRITPFIIKQVNFELKWANPGNIFSVESPVATTKAGIWSSLQFQLHNAYISYQNVLANPSLINSYSTLSNKNNAVKDVIENVPLAYPSWIIKNIFKYDNKVVPEGQSSILLSLKGRNIPESLLIIIRRKAMIDSQIGNYRFMDFPKIENISFSSPTYSHLKYLESNRRGISDFHTSLAGISCYADYKEKTEKNKNRINKQLDYLAYYSSRSSRNLPLIGTSDLITTPEIFLKGHCYFIKSYRKAVMCGPGIRSKQLLADLKIDIQMSARTTEELIIEVYGNSDAILTVNPDRSFRVSHDDVGTNVKESIKIHEKMSGLHEDLNIRMKDV